MASIKKFTYYMERDASFWLILVNKKETTSKGGQIGQKGRLFSTKIHKNLTEAKKYAEKQMKSKENSGFILKKDNSRKVVSTKTPQNKSPGQSGSYTAKNQNERPRKSRLNRNPTVVLARDKSMLSPGEKRELLKRPTQFGNWSLSRIPSLTVGAEELYVPSRNDWPVDIDAPVIWHCANYCDKSAYGIYVDDNRCLFGNEGGKVIELNHEGEIVRIYNLHDGVKCIVKDGDFLYVGCNDGGVYELSNGEARLMYGGFTHFGQVCWLDVWQGYIAMSDNNGQVALLDHDGDLLWKKQSPGVGGWMVRLDVTGVYHGYCGGVSKYRRQNGTLLWTTNMDVNNSIYFGVQDSTSLLVAENTVVRKIDKETGQILRTYQKENCGPIMSNEAGPQMVFAGGDCIVCYDDRTADTIYKLSYSPKPYSMQYHKGRLFCVGEDGLNVIDLTEDCIKTCRKGEKLKTFEISPNKTGHNVTPLRRLESVQKQNKSQVLVKCVRENSKLRVRPVSESYNLSWNCQFPLDVRKEGAVYVVEKLIPCEEAQFYRVHGTIHELESA